MSKSRRQFSPEGEAQYLQEAEREGHGETCRKYNLASSVLAYWIRKDGLKPRYSNELVTAGSLYLLR